MKKLLFILLLIPFLGFSQTKVENFCYDKQNQLIGSLFSTPDTTVFFKKAELQPEYTNLTNVLCQKYGVVYDSITSFLYQNVSQTGIPNTERFGLKTNENDNYTWLVINQPNFTEQELTDIYLFGEKLKQLILK